MGVLETLRARYPRDTSMNHPLAGAIRQTNQAGGHARSLTGPHHHEPPEGQSYAFSFILVGKKT